MEKVVFCIKFLGRGKFGSVFLVHNKKNIYAIKAISRKSVELQKNVIKIFCEWKKSNANFKSSIYSKIS